MITTNDFYLEQRIHNVLTNLGVRHSFKGYKCLYQSIIELLDEVDSEDIYVTKSLYIKLSKKFNCKPEAVERNIRTVIQHIPDSDYLRSIFPLSGNIHHTNKEFLLHITRYIKSGGV